MHVDGSVCVTHDGTCDVTLSVGEIGAKNALVTGANYAEFFYIGDSDLESGEVVCIDVTQDNTVQRCQRRSDSNVMGIISSNLAIIGNTQAGFRDNPNYVIVGMLGKVPAFVTDENGPIRPVGSLTSSLQPGKLMKANAGDSTVGVALEGLKKKEGKINVLISRKNKSLTVSQLE